VIRRLLIISTMSIARAKMISCPHRNRLSPDGHGERPRRPGCPPRSHLVFAFGSVVPWDPVGNHARSVLPRNTLRTGGGGGPPPGGGRRTGPGPPAKPTPSVTPGWQDHLADGPSASDRMSLVSRDFRRRASAGTTPSNIADVQRGNASRSGGLDREPSPASCIVCALAPDFVCRKGCRHRRKAGQPSTVMAIGHHILE